MNAEIESIEAYRDYTYIMYIVCDKTASYYSKIKHAINIPIVLCSTALSILNTTYTGKEETFYKMKNSGIALNFFIALSIAILNMYKITEKEFFFSSQSVNFFKIYNKINIEIAKSKSILAPVDIINIITEYNLLCENINFHIPSHIRNKIRSSYKTYKMPFLISNTKKRSNRHNLFKYFYKDHNKCSDCEEKGYQSASYSYYVSDSNDSVPDKSPHDKSGPPSLSHKFSCIPETSDKKKSSHVAAMTNFIDQQWIDYFKADTERARSSRNFHHEKRLRNCRSSSPVRNRSLDIYHDGPASRRRSYSPSYMVPEITICPPTHSRRQSPSPRRHFSQLASHVSHKHPPLLPLRKRSRSASPVR